MKVKIKRDNNEVLGATIECSPLEFITIRKALDTQLLADKTLFKEFYNTERDIRLVEGMIADMRGEE